MSEKDFVDFIESNQGIIHKICRIYTAHQADYDDLFQEIMLQLWQSIHRFKGEAKLTTWMYRVGLFTAITHRKKQQRLTMADTAEASNLPAETDQDDERQASLITAIQQLSESDRGMVMLYLDDKSYKEISAILGLSESNVGVRLNRIKSKLKTLIKD